jgi:hypothetical protein
MIYTLPHPKTFTWSCVNVNDFVLHFLVLSVKNIIDTIGTCVFTLIIFKGFLF